MGIFSGKTRTYVSASFTEFMEEKTLPDTVKTSLLENLLTGGSAPDTIINDIINGPPTVISRVSKWAKSGKYPYGVPRHNITQLSDVEAIFRNFLLELSTNPVNIIYSSYSPINEQHVLWQMLHENNNYNETANTLELANTPYTVYVNYLTPVVSGFVEDSEDPEDPNELIPVDPATYASWETPAHSRPHPWRDEYPPLTGEVIYDETGGTGASVDFIWKNTDSLIPNEVQTSETFIAIAEENPDAEFFQAKFSYSTMGVNKIYYFTYQGTEGTYPELDSAISPDLQNTADFMPYFHLRHNKIDLTRAAVRNTPAFKRSNQLFKMMGMDFVGLGDTINENPDIKYIEQASVGFFYKLNTEFPLGKQYAWYFFDWLHDLGKLSTSSVRVQDALLNVGFSYENLIKTTVNGSIGEIGTVKIEFVKVNQTIPTYTIDGGFKQVIKVKGAIKLKKQITDTTYSEITLNDIKSFFGVPGKNVIGTAEKFNDDDFNILLPISKMLVERHFKFSEREKVYYGAMGLVVTTKKRVKGKWYQRGFFKILMIVVAVVITVVSYGSAASAAAGLVAGATAGGVAMAVAIALMKKLLIDLLISYAFKLVIQEIGVEAAGIIAILAIVAGGAKYALSSGKSAEMGAKLLSLGSSFATAVNQGIQKELAGIQKSMLNNEQWYKESLDIIQNAREEMGLDFEALIDPYLFIQKDVTIKPNESIDLWLARTIHSSNIGTLVLEYPRTYVEGALNLDLLPKYREQGEA